MNKIVAKLKYKLMTSMVVGVMSSTAMENHPLFQELDRGDYNQLLRPLNDQKLTQNLQSILKYTKIKELVENGEAHEALLNIKKNYNPSGIFAKKLSELVFNVSSTEEQFNNTNNSGCFIHYGEFINSCEHHFYSAYGVLLIFSGDPKGHKYIARSIISKDNPENADLAIQHLIAYKSKSGKSPINLLLELTRRVKNDQAKNFLHDLSLCEINSLFNLNFIREAHILHINQNHSFADSYTKYIKIILNKYANICLFGRLHPAPYERTSQHVIGDLTKATKLYMEARSILSTNIVAPIDRSEWQKQFLDSSTLNYIKKMCNDI